VPKAQQLLTLRPETRTIDLKMFAFAVLGAVQVTLIATITVITVALPAIRRDLRLDDAAMVLVTSAYGLAFGGLLLLGGRLADAWGRRRTFVVGTAVFGLASAAAGLGRPSPPPCSPRCTTCARTRSAWRAAW
jgi:MFS family permease